MKNLNSTVLTLTALLSSSSYSHFTSPIDGKWCTHKSTPSFIQYEASSDPVVFGPNELCYTFQTTMKHHMSGIGKGIEVSNIKKLKKLAGLSYNKKFYDIFVFTYTTTPEKNIVIKTADVSDLSSATLYLSSHGHLYGSIIEANNADSKNNFEGFAGHLDLVRVGDASKDLLKAWDKIRKKTNTTQSTKK